MEARLKLETLVSTEQPPADTGVTPAYCRRCGVGPFVYVAERPDPELCLDCGREASIAADPGLQAHPAHTVD